MKETSTKRINPFVWFSLLSLSTFYSISFKDPARLSFLSFLGFLGFAGKREK